MDSSGVGKEIVERLPWHKPEVQHLEISLSTQAPGKDTSYEDGRVKGAGFPPDN